MAFAQLCTVQLSMLRGLFLTRSKNRAGPVPESFTSAMALGRRYAQSMKIAIGSDHAGFDYKERIKALLESLGHEVRDFGTPSSEPVDYPVFVRPTAESVARGECERGIVLGGSGNGEAIVANKVHGIRCALCWSHDTARWGREHNDANVLAIGQRTIPAELALEIVRIWLDTAFAGGRHAARVSQIED
jgi:ribose 5-phosphate isomerase B